MIYIAIAEEITKTTINLPIEEFIKTCFNWDRNLPFSHDEIDFLILLNLSERRISKADLEACYKIGFQYLFPEEASLGERRLRAPWLVTARVFNIEDLGIVKVDKESGDAAEGLSLKNINLNQLKNLIKDRDAITYSAKYSSLAIHILNELGNVSVYRKSYLRSSVAASGWIMEEHVQSYLNFHNYVNQHSDYSKSEFYIPRRFVD